jgi:hypothetical protein
MSILVNFAKKRQALKKFQTGGEIPFYTQYEARFTGPQPFNPEVLLSQYGGKAKAAPSPTKEAKTPDLKVDALDGDHRLVYRQYAELMDKKTAYESRFTPEELLQLDAYSELNDDIISMQSTINTVERDNKLWKEVDDAVTDKYGNQLFYDRGTVLLQDLSTGEIERVGADEYHKLLYPEVKEGEPAPPKKYRGLTNNDLMEIRRERTFKDNYGGYRNDSLLRAIQGSKSMEEAKKDIAQAYAGIGQTEEGAVSVDPSDPTKKVTTTQRTNIEQANKAFEQLAAGVGTTAASNAVWAQALQTTKNFAEAQEKYYIALAPDKYLTGLTKEAWAKLKLGQQEPGGSTPPVDKVNPVLGLFQDANTKIGTTTDEVTIEMGNQKIYNQANGVKDTKETRSNQQTVKVVKNPKIIRAIEGDKTVVYTQDGKETKLEAKLLNLDRLLNGTFANTDGRVNLFTNPDKVLVNGELVKNIYYQAETNWGNPEKVSLSSVLLIDQNKDAYGVVWTDAEGNLVNVDKLTGQTRETVNKVSNLNKEISAIEARQETLLKNNTTLAQIEYNKAAVSIEEKRKEIAQYEAQLPFKYTTGLFTEAFVPIGEGKINKNGVPVAGTSGLISDTETFTDANGKTTYLGVWAGTTDANIDMQKADLAADINTYLKGITKEDEELTDDTKFRKVSIFIPIDSQNIAAMFYGAGETMLTEKANLLDKNLYKK